MPENQNDATVPSLGKPDGWNLQRGHGARIKPAQQRQHAIAKRELGLPDRQQDIDQVARAGVPRMRRSADGERAPGGGLNLRPVSTR